MNKRPTHTGLAASDWVVRWTGLLPAGAHVLDVACGSGRHVKHMAQRELVVTALDRDAAAMEPLRHLSWPIEVVVADIENNAWPLPGQQFAAIVIANYLWRPLWPQLISSLAPGGMLVHETFSVDHASIGKPSNPDFLLRHGELLEVASTAGLRVLGYEDGFLAPADRFVQRIAAIKAPGHAIDAPALSAPPPRFAL